MVVEDVSMAPTLAAGDRLLVDRRALRRRPPRPGEIVVLSDPSAPSRWLVKRVAAVGPAVVDTVRSGVRVRAGGADTGASEEAIESTDVPAGSVFVVSDGPVRGRDSRTFGPVPHRALLGIVWYRYAPAARAGPIPSLRS